MTSEPWIYHSSNTVKIAGDYRNTYWDGLIVRMVQNGVEKFFRITNVSYSDGYTYLTLNGGGLYTLENTTITEHQHSLYLAPRGFPISFDLLPQYLEQSDHASTSLHTPGSVVPVVTSVGNPGSDSNIPSEKAVRSAIDNRIPAGTTKYSIPRWSGTAWVEAPLVSLQDQVFQLTKEYTMGSDWVNLLAILADAKATSSASGNLNGLTAAVASKISSGVTLTGQNAIYAHNWRGYHSGDKGTLATGCGIDVSVAHVTNGGVSPTTTWLHGIRIGAGIDSGTVTNLALLSLESYVGGGTVGTAWGIRQTSTFNNYFEGRIGIKTTPTYDLHLKNDSAAKPSTNTWTVSSDRRLKENIIDADLDRCLEIVKQLPLRRFTWRDEYIPEDAARDRSKLGWIADEVESVFPKAVQTAPFVRNKIVKKMQTDENGNEYEVEETVSETVFEDCKYLDSDQVIAALYGAVQKLIQIVEQQQVEIEKLKSLSA